MIRLHMIVEGHTEEEFVKSVLVDHFGNFDISTDVRRVETGRHRKTIFRGGVSSYQRVKKDLVLWMKEDQNADSFFTTMVDLYRLPNDFPSFVEARLRLEPYQRIEMLEAAFGRDIGNPRFIPYIQLHEFEALLLVEPSQFDVQFAEYATGIQNLVALSAQFASPELIDDGEQTAPSKRIIEEISGYEGAKPSAGPAIARRIGVQLIRNKSPHFDGWLSKIEKLGSTSPTVQPG
jgi:hypothetical protein